MGDSGPHCRQPGESLALGPQRQLQGQQVPQSTPTPGHSRGRAGGGDRAGRGAVRRSAAQGVSNLQAAGAASLWPGRAEWTAGPSLLSQMPLQPGPVTGKLNRLRGDQLPLRVGECVQGSGGGAGQGPGSPCARGSSGYGGWGRWGDWASRPGWGSLWTPSPMYDSHARGDWSNLTQRGQAAGQLCVPAAPRGQPSRWDGVGGGEEGRERGSGWAGVLRGSQDCCSSEPGQGTPPQARPGLLWSHDQEAQAGCRVRSCGRQGLGDRGSRKQAPGQPPGPRRCRTETLRRLLHGQRDTRRQLGPGARAAEAGRPAPLGAVSRGPAPSGLWRLGCRPGLSPWAHRAAQLSEASRELSTPETDGRA